MSSKFITFVMYLILLIVFLGLINMIFNLHRFAFIGEFLILLLLFILAIIASVGINSNFRWAWILLAFFFTFVFVDMIFIYTLSKMPRFFLLLLVTVIVGFFISVFSIKKPREVKAKTYKSGKYVASKTGKKFHMPECDWAKKIKKDNAVWFDTEQEAKKAGYKEDNCV